MFQLTNSEPLRDFLHSEAIEYKLVKDGKALEFKKLEDFNKAEMFDLGEQFGRQEEKKKHTAPETFTVFAPYDEVLQKCMNEYGRERYITIDSIKIKKGENASEVTVYPTQAVHLFNLGSDYGKAVQLPQITELKEELQKCLELFKQQDGWEPFKSRIETITNLLKQK